MKEAAASTTASVKGALAAVLLIAPVAAAQRVETSVDLGGAVLRYADTLSTRTATVTPRLAANWNTDLLEASGSYSQFTSGGSSVQGLLSESHFIPTNYGLLGEIGAFAGGSSHSDGTRAGEVIANVRAHFPRGGSELFFGAGAGRTWDSFEGRSLLLLEAGTSIAWRTTNALLSVSPTMVGNSIRYADAQASVSWNHDRIDFATLLGVRLGDQLTTLGAHGRAWANVSAAFQAAPRLSLVAAGGSYPVDPTQGFPGGKFISLSLRLTRAAAVNESPSPQTPQQATTPDLLPTPDATPVGFEVRRADSGSRTLRVNAPGARSVEVSGDFTNWEPVQLSPGESGWWSITLPIKRGKYQVNVRTNGGKWVAPPGTLAMSDEFGGTVGLLVVE